MEWTITKLATLALLTIIAIAIIFFIVSGISTQSGIFQGVTDTTISNLSQIANESRPVIS